MPDRTQPGEVLQTDVKTEIFPEYISEETSLIPGKASNRRRAVVSVADTVSTTGKKRRGLPIALITFLVFLVGAVVAGGLYVFKPSIFGITQNDETTGGNLPAANANSAVNKPVDSALTNAVLPANTDPAIAANSEAVRPSERTAETAKSGKTIGKTKNSAGENVDINGDPENPDEVTITQRDKNGKVTTTRINPNIQPMNVPVPPVEGFDPFPEGLPSGMTPAQRRRLQLKLKNLQQRQTPNTPDNRGTFVR